MRGALIVFEGLDRSGKSTQCLKLVEALNSKGITSMSMRFPDRSTTVGKVINDYLAFGVELSDEAVHLIFSANRWELASKIKKLLNEGTTVIVDRYSYSGVAYSAAKKGMDMKWCKNPEIGLPKPDLVVYLQIGTEELAKRGGYGAERYENVLFLEGVRENYSTLMDASWLVILESFIFVT
ncbi:hypothetical protein AAG570_001796 [Ranatra chinensis]|uniref:Thymidylate kinase n=1 Tax=Ranatra chinensis TaxID=642074 RepID=A0ABD0Y9T8_9HEMI